MTDDNPYERYELDPLAGPGAITARLRELAEDAEDELVRARIREAWEALTMHPRRRLDLALRAHPESRADPGRPPRPTVVGPAGPPQLDELVALPPLAELAGVAEVELADRPLEEDPILSPRASNDAGSSRTPDPYK